MGLDFILNFIGYWFKKIIDEKIKCLECYVKVNKPNNYSIKWKYRNYQVIITLIQQQTNNNQINR